MDDPLAGIKNAMQSIDEIIGTSPKNVHRFLNSKAFRDWAAKIGYVRATTHVLSIRRADLEATEIIDAGVQSGTPWLYRAFPEAAFVLVDPLRGAESRLRSKPANYTFMNVAVGSEKGVLEINEQGGSSTFLERSGLTEGDANRAQLTDRYDVRIETLDSIIDQHCRSDKIGIKLDIEGYEIEAIKGLEKHLDRVEFVISEASVLKRYVESYNFSDLVAAFRDKGFVFYNLMNPTSISAPMYYDILFLRKGDKRFEERAWLRPLG